MNYDFEKLDQIEELDLNTSSIGPNGAIEIAKLLTTNTTLHTLILWSNRIDVKSTISIAKS